MNHMKLVAFQLWGKSSVKTANLFSAKILGVEGEKEGA